MMNESGGFAMGPVHDPVSGLIIIGIAAPVKWIIKPGPGGQKERTPLEILQERYVRGDIDREVYEQKKNYWRT